MSVVVGSGGLVGAPLGDVQVHVEWLRYIFFVWWSPRCRYISISLQNHQQQMKRSRLVIFSRVLPPNFGGSRISRSRIVRLVQKDLLIYHIFFCLMVILIRGCLDCSTEVHGICTRTVVQGLSSAPVEGG
jgi:hypothetical protein